MAHHVARPSIVAALAFAILCSGCAATGYATSPPWPLAIADAAQRVSIVQSATPTLDARASRPLASNGPEDFVCHDGARVEVRYSETRDGMSVRLNGAPPVALRRADESGLTAYRSERMVLRRSGPRIAVSSEGARVTVREGDSLSRIALRIYGDHSAAADIARANAIANPDLIFPGQVLDLPLVEHRCRRSERRLSYVGAGAGPASLQRRAFSPPSSRQPELRRVRATATDPPSP